MRIGVRPRPDETLARHRQAREQARNCILVGIGPAAHGVNRTLNRAVILAHRTALPVRIAPLVLQPDFEEERCVRQALQPRRSPNLSDKHRVGREAHRAEKEEGPLKPGRNKRAPHVVGVIGIPVITRTDGDDRLERRRTARRNLPAPGDAHHPHHAAAPGLRRQPRYDLHAIGQLLLRVLVQQQARGLAAAANVDANAGVAVAGKVGMSQRIPFVCTVALTVWQIFQYCGHRVAFGVVRQPDAGGERRAVFERY
jgi:hypothetical protein